MYALAAEEYAALAANENATADILFRLAESYYRLDKTAEADAATARLVEKFPGTVEALRAQLQRAQNAEPERAIELLTPFRAWRGDPALETALLLALADAFSRNAKPADAISAYEEILKRFPNDPAASLARLNAGLALLATHNADEQRRGTQYLLATARDNPQPEWAAEALYALAQHEYGQKNYADSVGYFNLLATQYPDSTRTKTSHLQAAWAGFLADDRATALKRLDANPIADAKSPDQQSWLYLRANILRLNDDPAARAAYEKLLADFPNPDPRFVDARFEYASLLFAKKDFQTLHNFFAQHRDIPGPVEEVAWMRAQAAQETNNLDQALAFFKNFEKDFQKSELLPLAINRTAGILALQNDHVGAAQTYVRLAQNHPGTSTGKNAWYKAGIEWGAANDNGQAIAAFQQALNVNPDAPHSDHIAHALAALALAMKKDAVAEAASTHIIDRFPQSEVRAEAFFYRAEVRYRANDIQRAEEDFRASLAANPDDEIREMALNQLGVIYHAQERYPEAAECFQPLVANPPAHLKPSVMFWLGTYQLEAHQPVLAEAAARALLANAPDIAMQQHAHILLGRALHGQDKNADAVASLKTALALDVNTEAAASGAALLGALFLQANDLPAADAAFQDAIKRASTPELLSVRADAYLGLAQSAEAADKPDDALRYNLAVALLFDDPERVPLALDRAITLLEKLNRPAEAKQQLQELLTRYPDSEEAKGRRTE